MNKEHRRPRVLLLGNGINRSYNGDSWDALLNSITKRTFSTIEKDALEKMSFPMRAILVSDNDVKSGVDGIAPALVEIEPCDEQRDLLQSIINLGFDAILTTNYSYEIEKALDSEFTVKLKKKSKYRVTTRVGKKSDDQFGLFKYMNVASKEIWHIHGEAARPNSVILGHRYYGKMIGRINDRLSDVFSEYKLSIKNNTEYIPRSWVDYLMVGDVYIAGMGLDLSEMDLWWLLDIKQEHLGDFGDCKVVWFEPNLDEEKNLDKKMLASCYGIDIHTKPVSKDEYKAYYAGLSSKIKKILNKE
ncbi:MAG: SIR2 family protein [Saccharofermentans sp.]|nr:SIR2 family protein [Saccharofermentans sp.]